MDRLTFTTFSGIRVGLLFFTSPRFAVAFDGIGISLNWRSEKGRSTALQVKHTRFRHFGQHGGVRLFVAFFHHRCKVLLCTSLKENDVYIVIVTSELTLVVRPSFSFFGLLIVFANQHTIRQTVCLNTRYGAQSHP
jgi:hypothetical protein